MKGIPMTDEKMNDQIDLSIDVNNMYKEESYTDLKVGAVRRLVPVNPDGSEDKSRTAVFIGSTQLLTPEGPLPVQTHIPANNLKEALEAFSYSMHAAINKMKEELEKLAKEQKDKEQSRIIVPGRE
jgi:hypothetical protein